MAGARELYQAGQLKAAIAALNDEVKKHPADTGRRGLLCELLCFAGNFERADNQLDTIGTQDPQVTLALSLWRHLIRAEQARQQFYNEGRLPDFVGDAVPDLLRLYLDASISLREGQPQKAVELLTRAEEQRPHVRGTCDGQAFDDFRDLDDLIAPVFEVLTSTGKYYWIPIDRVESIEFRPPTRPRDLLWREAKMVVEDGPDGVVYLPTIYAGTAAQEDEKMKLGRSTDWRGGEGTPMRGLGQREFLIGDGTRSIMDLKEIALVKK